MRHRLRRHAGLSLIECAVVTAITAVIVGTALPGFHEAYQRRQLEGTTAQLETDLQLARSEAVARNEGVRVAFARGEHGSCYLLHTGAAGACRCEGGGAATCEAGAALLRSVHLSADAPVQLRSNSASMLFDPVKGTVTPTATLRAQSGIGSLHLVVNVMGRIRACTPDAVLPGYRRC
jgi:type IV fimbrial biogenesis protein FimT